LAVFGAGSLWIASVNVVVASETWLTAVSIADAAVVLLAVDFASERADWNAETQVAAAAQ